MTVTANGKGHKVQATDVQRERGRAILDAFMDELRPHCASDQEAIINGAAAAIAAVVLAATDKMGSRADAIPVLAGAAANIFQGLPVGHPLTAQTFAFVAAESERFHRIAAELARPQ